MKTPSFCRLAPLLAACVLALTSCGVPYDHRSYVRGTGHGIDHEPVPTHVHVVETNGNAITSGYSNRDAFYYGKKYYGNRYYGGMFYGYNNPPAPYTTDINPYDRSQATYFPRSLNSRSY